MRILHTSDWHLGRQLYGRARYAEFEAFLGWLTATIDSQKVDTLLVAGDIFDNGTPSNRAQELYYGFLGSLARSACRHVVIIAGNHDSPTFLDAPRTLLRSRDVHVIGTASGHPPDEVVILKNGNGEAELIVCAVPYLRDRDIRTTEAGESVDDKERKLLAGIRAHYANVAAYAEETRQALHPGVPIVAMGHLFTTGGHTIEGDGVRDLYVGTAAHIHASIFPPCFDYVALGHLHVPQSVNGAETVRYSGSPIPMGFGEAKQQKSVALVEFSGTAARVETLLIPCFQHLERIRGDRPAIAKRLSELAGAGSDAWLEIVYDGDEVVGDLREALRDTLAGSRLELLQVKHLPRSFAALVATDEVDDLKDLDVAEVFERCMMASGVPDAQKTSLRQTFNEALQQFLVRDAAIAE